MITLKSGESIPTEPDEFDLVAVQAEHLQLAQLLPKLDSYWQLEFREIPEQLQTQVRSLALFTPPTKAGLERMYGILWRLKLVQVQLERLLNQQSIAPYVASTFGTEAIASVENVRPDAPRVTSSAAGTLTVAVDPVEEGSPATPTATTLVVASEIAPKNEALPATSTGPANGAVESTLTVPLDQA